MLKRIAFIFPGQGSQALGMLSGLAGRYPLVHETFTEASEVLGFDVWQLSQQGPAELLNQTQYTQPTLLAASVALWRLWQQESEERPLFMAGHSLGEYAALVCAEAIDFSAALLLVAERGRCMQAAVPEGVGAMAAVIGLESEQLQGLCDALRDGQVLAPANYNSVMQTVVAGHREAVDRMLEQAKQMGAKIAKRIPVSVPSHCALMGPAAEQFARYLKEKVTFTRPRCAVVNNVDVRVEMESEAIQSALIRQLFSPVRWLEIIQWLQHQQLEFFVECGPGKVLSGLNKSITTIPTFSICDPETLQRALMA